MGSVIRRSVLLLALVALFVPTGAKAATTTFLPPYANGPSGGDEYNSIERDPTGDMSVVRLNPVPANGGLGCGGTGGWATFEIPYNAAAPITAVTVDYAMAVVDPYAFMSLSVYQDDHFVDTQIERGPIVGDGTIVLHPRTAATGDVKIWFGLQLSSACPNIDLARASFTSVTVTE